MAQQRWLIFVIFTNFTLADAAPECGRAGGSCPPAAGVKMLQAGTLDMSVRETVQLDEDPSGEKEKELFKLFEALQPETLGKDKDNMKTTVDKLLAHAKNLKNEDERMISSYELEMISTEFSQQSETILKENQVLDDEVAEQQKKNEDELDNHHPAKDSPSLFQADLSSLSNDSQHADLLELHSGLKNVIEKFGVDTSAARSRTNEEHNNLVVDFILETFAPELSLLSNNASSADDSRAPSDAKLANKCLHGMLTAAPAKYCWKPGGDHSQAPWTCPSSYPTHWGAECFKKCSSGYYWVNGGTCWAYCDSGYADHGATCYWSWWSWYAKHHYWASRQHKHCGSGWYKSGLLCYRPCGDYYGEVQGSYEGCGDLACSPHSQVCFSTIMNMVMEIGFSIASIAALAATAGAAAPAVVAGQQVAKAMGRQMAMKTARYTAKGLLRAGKNRFTNVVLKNFKKKFTRAEIAQTAAEGWAENAVKNFCNEYAKASYNKMDPNYQAFDPKQLDPSGTWTAVHKCKKESGMSCAQSIVSAVGTFDPTGLMGVASAFMHDNCAPPTSPGWFYDYWWSRYR